MSAPLSLTVWRIILRRYTDDGALDRLSAALFQKMEHLDPSPSSDPEVEDWGWSALSEVERGFYRSCVTRVLSELCDEGLFLSLTNDDPIMRGTVTAGNICTNTTEHADSSTQECPTKMPNKP